MKRKALLLGFQYEGDKYLPGISIDLYLIYNFLKKIGWKDEEIMIYTDIKQDSDTELLRAAILSKLVDVDILSFIEQIKKKGIYTEFRSSTSLISKLNQDSERLFIYYTGHCKDGNIVLPNGLISYDYFLSILQSSERENMKEAFIIFDCCEGDLKLPFSHTEDNKINSLMKNSINLEYSVFLLPMKIVTV